MLEFIRRKSTSFLSWFILGGIALVFGLQFGLPSDSLTLGPDGLAEVYGEEIRKEDFNFQTRMASTMGFAMPKEAELREMIGVNEELLDGAVERMLLAHEARKMGLAATQKEAEDLVLDGHAMMFGIRNDFLRKEDKFNYSIFKNNWLRSLGINEDHYLQHQSEELLAQTLRDLMTASIVVPESEVRREYEATANTLTLRYARYEFAAFADLVDPTPEQLDAYVAAHADALEQRYESQKTRFTALPKQARLQLVQVAANPEAKAALEQARAGIEAGTERLSGVARTRSMHDTAGRGGDYGWVDEDSQTASDLPDAVRRAVPGLATEAVSEVIEADGSLWLLRVTERREGDVPKELALRELAEEGVRDEQGRELARRAAEEDQNAVAGGTPLLEVFARPGALGETTLFGGKPIEALPLEGAPEGSPPTEGAPQAPAEGAPAAPTDPLAGVARPKAELQSTIPFAKGQKIPELGAVPGLVDDAWAQEGDAELLDGIYEVQGAVLLAGVENREKATDEGYAQVRQELYDRLRRLEASRLVGTWAKRRCFDAKGRGDIKVSEETIKRLTTYDTPAEDEGEGEGKDGEEPEKPEKPAFTVCDRVGGGGGFLTARARQ
ncbi:peptidylprolyl isomerase [Paraliomyxa miuraensis]|uniref:peptidylprolyl isomerase n=1 Tax=Paraliomyxa miuraensis TaxID=376150 RepID=UPI00224F0CE8|nr:peptidylprolyl isomerase [Paraliomyxa miuraensis]MCX4242085.1 peptidylprolyl isomerase [Paraliomyxa miuraensis]